MATFTFYDPEAPILKIPGLIPRCWPYADPIRELLVRGLIRQRRHSLTQPKLQPSTPRSERNDPFRLSTPDMRLNGSLVRSRLNDSDTITETIYSRPSMKNWGANLATMPPATLVAIVSLAIVAFTNLSKSMKCPVPLPRLSYTPSKLKNLSLSCLN